MNLVEVMERFPDQETCIEHLEEIRWGDKPRCPKCEGGYLTRKNESGHGRIGRWHCSDCGASLKVTSGTIFQGTKIPLQKWFLAISLMANAKKSLSSCQLARDMGLQQRAAWRIMMKIRTEMGKNSPILTGIVEVDETYIGGRNRKDYEQEAGEPCPRGRGTMKNAVIGAVSRDGQVVTQLIPDISGETIANFIRDNVDTENAKLYTDQFKGYNAIGKEMEHETLNRSGKWEKSEIHTNTIEGFWTFIKRAWYGSHHHYSTRYTPLYLAEACYKYNNRKTDIFIKFLTECMEFGARNFTIRNFPVFVGK